MKKALKIIGITLASLVGLVLIAAIIAVSMVTSSGKLTKMVNKYAPEFVNCEMALGKADLTLFKTFPEVGVEIENVALINPMAGSPSDTGQHRQPYRGRGCQEIIEREGHRGQEVHFGRRFRQPLHGFHRPKQFRHFHPQGR